MSFVKNLTQYNQGQKAFKPPSSPTGFIKKFAHPAAEDEDEDVEEEDHEEQEDMNVDEDCVAQVPTINFK